MKRLDHYSIRELSKRIYRTNIMPSANSTSFVELGELLLKRIQEGADLDKINRIVSSELITSYGLDVSEEMSIKISEDVYRWNNA